MARIRTVKPELHSSPSLGSCSIQARWVFVGLLTVADDEGRIRDLPKMILGNLFPLDDNVTVDELVVWLNELEQVDCLRRYSAEGSNFIYLPNWKKHQRISKATPSRMPAPPSEDSQGIPGNPGESAEAPRDSPLEVRSSKFEERSSNVESPVARDLHKPGEAFPQSLLCLRNEDNAQSEAFRLYPGDPDRQKAAMDAWWAVANAGGIEHSLAAHPQRERLKPPGDVSIDDFVAS